ncbi:carbohydrate kinase family protein [uncultured Friedmanniella sp.]|uniref:carbohydrate kinase family protein n=1 Tax=uncultured Friedmanniella sp. TaxID=335381 RepID=UPI0035C98702
MRSAATTPEVDLLFAGSVFCDLVFAGVPVPDPGGEVFARAFRLTPGGVANRAVAASRLGARTALLSALGDDPLGRELAVLLAAEPQLDLTWLATRPGWQTPVTVSLTGEQEREFITYQEPDAPLAWGAERPRVGATHVGVAHELPGWVRRLRSQGTVVYGGVGWDSTGQWSTEVLSRLDQVDVFVPNDLEAMRYTRTESPTEAARALGRHVSLSLVTCGSRGVVAFDAGADRLVEVPAVRVTALDPTGAGDVFVASFMASHAFGWPLEHRLALATLCASLSVRTLGGAASAPTRRELVAFLDADRPPGDWSAIRDWASTSGPA